MFGWFAGIGALATSYNGYQQNGLQSLGQGMGMGAGGFGGATGNNWYSGTTTLFGHPLEELVAIAREKLRGAAPSAPAPLDMKEPLLPYLRGRTKAWLDGVKLKS